MNLEEVMKVIEEHKDTLEAYKDDELIGIMTNGRTVMLEFSKEGNIGNVVFIARENK